MEKINVEDQFSKIKEYYSPYIIAELNGQAVKAAKLKGPFTWHSHPNEDELFYVLKGKLTIEFRDRDVDLHPGEMLVVPKGVEHRPVAEQEVHLLLFEPLATVNTGDTKSDFTKEAKRF